MNKLERSFFKTTIEGYSYQDLFYALMVVLDRIYDHFSEVADVKYINSFIRKYNARKTRKLKNRLEDESNRSES